ncbi:MAG: hypothetical protein E7388_05680 [Ruminococcaceae bacterium]|nr:hypothetical protein [Oscillospiraceae bacterium]
MSALINANWTVQPNDEHKIFENVVFEKSSKGLDITLRNTSLSSMMKLIVDDVVKAEFAINNTAPENETEIQRVEIPEISPGAHTIRIYTDRHGALIKEFHFTENSPYDEIKYEPSTAEVRDTLNDLTTAVDMLGRSLPDAAEVGAPKDKLVGIFYWTWRQKDINNRPVNLTQLMKRCPEVEFNIHHPEWTYHDVVHWNEPFYGFYRNDDPYVIRKHMQYFADAGVDVIIFDNTNGSFLWKDSFMPLLAEMKKAKDDGIKVPKIVFMLNFAGIYCTYVMLKGLYQDLYKPGLYSDLWFMWDNKPLILAYKDGLPPEEGCCPEDTILINEIKDFFTYRKPQPLYAGGPWLDDQWGWLEIAPQNGYGLKPDGTYEMCTVGVAQNCREGLIVTHFNEGNTFGRSYTYKDKFAKLTEDSHLYGYNFQEQWDYAREIDPDFVFITGWNEWTMGKWTDESYIRDGSGQIAFVDHFDREHSRDIEPDIDGYLDTYYLQMAANIRRFKGLKHVEIPNTPVTVNDGDFEAWRNILPDYVAHVGSEANRDFKGLGGYHYINKSGRNNITNARVAYDKDNLYFYAETYRPLNLSGDHVMELLIDSDRNKATGWEGYDYLVSGGKIYEFTAEGKKEISEVKTFYNYDKMYVVIPRSMVGQDKEINLEFKWSDNIEFNDVMNFYKDGDCAPFGRFNYIYKI